MGGGKCQRGGNSSAFFITADDQRQSHRIHCSDTVPKSVENGEEGRHDGRPIARGDGEREWGQGKGPQARTNRRTTQTEKKGPLVHAWGAGAGSCKKGGWGLPPTIHGRAAVGVPWERVTRSPGRCDESSTPPRVMKLSQNDSLSFTLWSISQSIFFGFMADQHPDWTCASITYSVVKSLYEFNCAFITGGWQRKQRTAVSLSTSSQTLLVVCLCHRRLFDQYHAVLLFPPVGHTQPCHRGHPTDGADNSFHHTHVLVM